MAARELVFDIFAIDRASKVFNRVGTEAEGLGKKTTGMHSAAGVAVAAVATAVVAFGAKSIDAFGKAGAETLKLKRYLGGTTEEASRFRYEAKMSGIDTDTLSTAMGKMSKTLVGTTDTTKTLTTHVAVATGAWAKQTTLVKDAAGNFEKITKMVPVTKMVALSKSVTAVNPLIAKLGFNVKDAHGKMLPMNELLPKIADKFKSMPDGAEKTALAMQLFGKAGAGMLPMLNKGADGLKALGIESDKFGNTLNDKDTAAVKENIKQKREMNAAMEGLQIMLGRVLMPAVVSVTTKFTELARWFNENIKVMGPLVSIIGGLIAVIFTIIKATQAWTAIQGALNIIMAMNPIGIVILAVIALVAAIVLIATKTTWFQTIWEYMSGALGKAWQFMWNSILAPIIRFVLNGFASIVDGIANMLGVLGNIPGFGWAKTASDKMHDAANKAHELANGIKDIPDKVVTITVVVDGSGVSASIAHILGAINGAQTKGGRYASGTDYAPGGVALVGERGPEMVSLPRGSQVATAQNTKEMLGKHDGASPDVVAAIRSLGDRFGTELDRQARTIETMRRQMAGAR